MLLTKKVLRLLKKMTFFANKKFTEAEQNFEIVEFAAKSAIMSSFSLYGINFMTKLKKT